MSEQSKTCEQVVTQNLQSALAYLQTYLATPNHGAVLTQAIEAMVASLRQQGCIFACGNGGSMCDAMHFAEELSGRFRESRQALRAVAISDPGYLSCVANDFGYEQVFARYLEAHARPGDVLLAISTSGKSANVLAAVQAAKARGVKVVALTGHDDSAIHHAADIKIATPPNRYADRIQELHIKLIHTMIDGIETCLLQAKGSPA